MESTVQQEYFELIRKPSISSDPAHLKDCVDTAMWLKAWVEKLGFTAKLVTEGFAPPILMAELQGESPTTVLIYGHYDVQPVDPVELWNTPPFEPTIKDGRVYCRGSQDDKGQLFALLNGVRDFLDKAKVAGGLKSTPAIPTIKLCLEGQEESGSAALMAIAHKYRKELAANVLLVCDTNCAADMQPAIVAGLRGVSHFTVKLTGPNRDLHSGEYGGIAPNPARGIAELVASMFDKDGKIAVPGFMDGIEYPSEEELRLSGAKDSLKAVPTSSDTLQGVIKADIGCEPVGGVMENSFLPTIEVNGIHSGFGGAGSKTIIPAEAFSKISMRLVPGQTPKQAFQSVKAHLEAHCPKGMTISFPEQCDGAGGFRLPVNSPIFRLASDVLKEMDERGAVFQWDGASIPVVSVLAEVSGAAPLIVGWGQPEDRIHSPNESYGLNQFAKARDWGRRILEAL